MDNEEEIQIQNKKDEKIFLNGFAILLLIVGVLVMLLFYNKIGKLYTIASATSEIDMGATGQIGDFIAGVVGTLFALSGTLLIYMSFKEQNSQNKREAFESSFFEMVRLQRQNVSELKYSKFKINDVEISENRKVFKIIFDEFNECYREVSKFFRFTNDIIDPLYINKLTTIKDRINPNINLKEMAIIDISYSIVFFGISSEGEKVLRFRFKDKYILTEILQLIEYIKLKPKENNEVRFLNWSYIKGLSVRSQRDIIFDLYNYKRNSGNQMTLNQQELEYLSHSNYEKYYGGHQFRLGHYFRHLFQTYKYLHFNENINSKEKYFYGKTLRAQLSTYEQALLFINSISTLGMKWEFTPDIENPSRYTQHELKIEQNRRHIITHYNLIKNLPGEKMFGFRYKSYYPLIKYESEE